MYNHGLILVDLDDCLIESDKFVKKWMAQNKSKLPEEVFNFPDENWEIILEKMGEEKYRDFIRKVAPEVIEGMVKEVRPITNSVYALLILTIRGYNVKILTSRPSALERATVETVHRFYNCTEIYYKDSAIPGNKNATKADCCRYLGAEWLIDNLEKHTIPAAEVGIKSITFGTKEGGKIGDYLWNCPTWEDVLKVIQNK